MIRPYLYAALAATVIFMAWNWHSGRTSAAYERGKAEVLAEWDASNLAAARAAEQANKENQARKDAQNEAVSNARDERAQAAQRDSADLVRVAAERDRLRGALDIALNTISRCDVPTATADARADRSAAVRAVFDDLERAGAEMARAASGHAADSLMYQRGWPKVPEVKSEHP